MEKMTLSNVEFKKKYIIIAIKLNDKIILKQLQNIGIEIGVVVEPVLSNYKRRTFLIKINEISFALSKNICDEIEVYEL